MALRLYNSLSKENEDFSPINDKNVGIYTCGPTVYNYQHIGNYRAYIFADTLKRTLRYLGFNVKHIINITDVDDKTIRDSKNSGKSLSEFTQYYTKEFLTDLNSLNIIPADKFTKATDYIDQMVEIIEKLLEKGFAYKSEDGSVYFSIEKDKEYGKLSGLDRSTLLENADARMKSDEYEKDNVQDFALWKAWSDEDGDVFWETNLGKGRPGWHIECSAMSMTELGESFDIHTGGVDNMFPHHENEIAQSESSTGKTFVKTWMHSEHALVDGKKMSKSLGNVYLIKDLEEKDISPVDYRYFILGAHYRTKINFTWEAVKAAKIAREKLSDEFIEISDSEGEVDSEYKKRFTEIISDDLATPRALALVWELIKDEKISVGDKKETLLSFDEVLGLGLKNLKKLDIPENITRLVEEREIARKNKDWKLSDEIRDDLESLGYLVKDTENGPKISEKK